ncbi:hypothetical protein [Chryseobacterium luteum]|uniref:Uncharacterized protein n=1 Tax=Chryseobacterium luteum TaxID=421531 RepID=A0A085ZUL7_9FLAO|nr:hypothetical protein [Chryseobacterium luteum]KFF08131.1 hypothetical protein IX38_08300 [Chryseobacterium luteum]
MKKIIVTLFAALFISTIVFYISKNKTDITNYGMLFGALATIIAVPLIKFLFPVTKELKIGTSEFYPNLFHKTAEFLKKKRNNR